MQPTLYVIAGPNGIGKTTSVFDLVPSNIPIINSDEIAAAIRNAGIASTNVQEIGNREASRMIDEYMGKKNSFAIETNLADVETWKFLREIQKTGYNVNLIYLSCDELSLLNSRIDQRVLAGEHYVRPDIVEERYINSLKLLDHYFQVPDTIQLFDNSSSLVLIGEVRKGEVIHLAAELPAWVINNFSKQFAKEEKQENKISDLKSVNEVKKAYQLLKKKTSNVHKRKRPRP